MATVLMQLGSVVREPGGGSRGHILRDQTNRTITPVSQTVDLASAMEQLQAYEDWGGWSAHESAGGQSAWRDAVRWPRPRR